MNKSPASRRARTLSTLPIYPQCTAFLPESYLPLQWGNQPRFVNKLAAESVPTEWGIFFFFFNEVQLGNGLLWIGLPLVGWRWDPYPLFLSPASPPTPSSHFTLIWVFLFFNSSPFSFQNLPHLFPTQEFLQLLSWTLISLLSHSVVMPPFFFHIQLIYHKQ